MIEIPAIIIVIIITWFIAHKRGKKKGKKDADLDTYRYGFKNGVDSIERELYQLSSEDDIEIIRRVKKFAHNYVDPDKE